MFVNVTWLTWITSKTFNNIHLSRYRSISTILLLSQFKVNKLSKLRITVDPAPAPGDPPLGGAGRGGVTPGGEVSTVTLDTVTAQSHGDSRRVNS